MLKSTGVVRKMDDLGRVVIPKEMVRTLEFDENQAIEFYVKGEEIILRKYSPGCTFCKIAEGDLIRFEGKLICSDCRRRMPR